MIAVAVRWRWRCFEEKENDVCACMYIREGKQTPPVHLTTTTKLLIILGVVEAREERGLHA